MTLDARPLLTDDEQNTFTRLLVLGTIRKCDDHEGTNTMEPIDHPPGHEIERLNREIDEQYADAEWTPASVIAILLIALPFVAFGIYVLASAGVLWQVLVIFALVFGVWILFLKAIA